MGDRGRVVPGRAIAVAVVAPEVVEADTRVAAAGEVVVAAVADTRVAAAGAALVVAAVTIDD
jgi:hypothetical protein